MSQAISVSIIKTSREMEAALKIRQIVFVDEQHVAPEIEYDEFEDAATHVIAHQDGRPVGTGRWRRTQNGFKLERFAVLKDVRGQGVGAALLHFMLEQVDGSTTVYLNSQESAIGFYSKLGFEEQGDIFCEANIPHRKMVYKPSTPSD